MIHDVFELSWDVAKYILAGLIAIAIVAIVIGLIVAVICVGTVLYLIVHDKVVDRKNQAEDAERPLLDRPRPTKTRS